MTKNCDLGLDLRTELVKIFLLGSIGTEGLTEVISVTLLNVNKYTK